MTALSLHFQGVLETFGGFGMMAGPAIGGFLYGVRCYIFRPSVKPSKKTLPLHILKPHIMRKRSEK